MRRDFGKVGTLVLETIFDNKRNYRFAFLTVMSIFAMGQIAGSVDAAISKIGDEFMLSSSTALYTSTVPALACVVFSIIVGFIAGKKVSYKVVLYFSAIMVIVGGLLPFFAKNFAVLLVLRMLFGVGFGGMMSLENTFVSLTIPKEKRASVLGIATFVGFGTQCLLQLIGGFLADIHWNYYVDSVFGKTCRS